MGHLFFYVCRSQYIIIQNRRDLHPKIPYGLVGKAVFWIKEGGGKVFSSLKELNGAAID